MKIKELLEAVDSGEISSELGAKIKKLQFVIAHFDYIVSASNYEVASQELLLHCVKLDPVLVLLASSEKSSAKLLQKYNQLREEAITKVNSGV